MERRYGEPVRHSIPPWDGWLRFWNQDLERQFHHYYTRRVLMPFERNMHFAALTLFTMIYIAWMHDQPLTIRLGLFCLTTLFTLCSSILISKSPRLYYKFRTPIGILVHCFYPIQLHVISLSFPNMGPSLLAFWVRLSSRMLVSIAIQQLVQLPLPIHCTVQFLLQMVMLIVSKPRCSKFFPSNPDLQSLPYVIAWGLDRLSVIPALLDLASEVQLDSGNFEQVCWTIITTFRITTCLVIGSAVQCYLECKARGRFLVGVALERGNTNDAQAVKRHVGWVCSGLWYKGFVTASCVWWITRALAPVVHGEVICS